jgi:hypothetical protein
MKVLIGTLDAVLRIRDSTFSILDPGSRVDKIPDPHQKILVFLTKKTDKFSNIRSRCKSSQKYGFGIRDPEKTYSGYRIPYPGVKKAPDPGSGSAILSRTVCVFVESHVGGQLIAS